MLSKAAKDVELLVLQHENAVLHRQPAGLVVWGRRRIQGEPALLGHRVAPSTVCQIGNTITADFLYTDTVPGK